ncbi:MAG TPA: transglycosylase domain-containing protein [Candidatus Dormibacteraeota bacterium]|nr:transglycosylase domain-containing protein [Candidatus Dormibacteraeota bacterium]
MQDLPSRSSTFDRRSGSTRRRRAGRPRSAPAGHRRHRVLRFLGWLAAAGVLAGGIGIGGVLIAFAAFSYSLPSVTRLMSMGPPRDSYLLASNGTLLATLHEPGTHHIHVAYQAISPWVIQATVAVEDRQFFRSTGGINVPRILAAGLHDVAHPHSLQGASTIPEQLAKISFLTPDRTISRKIREVLLGAAIASHFTKSQILQMYLNRIDYGNQATGIGSAAELYFHIPASQLTLAQASMLAGIPDAPSAFDPLLYVGTKGPNYAKERQGVVLEAMVTNHVITQAQAHAAFLQPLTYYPWQDRETIIAPDFVNFAVGQLQQQFGEAYLNPGGWTIRTSLNLPYQHLGERLLQNKANNARLALDYNIHDLALVSIDPRNGEILTMIGTSNYQGPWGQINMTDVLRRPGSTFKLFTYTAAVASGKFTMTTPVLDAPININGYQPHNYDFRFHGICQLKLCLGNSFNIPAVKVEMQTGLGNVVTMAQRMGASSLLNPANTYGVALTLGGLSQGLTELDLAAGGSVLASGGILHQPTAILQVQQSGHVIYRYDLAQNSVQVVSPAVAYIMNAMLSNNNNRIQEFGYASHLTLPGRPVSAKTGTTDKQLANGGYSPFLEDNWTVGWTPQLLTAMWVGNPTGAPLSGVTSGISGAAPIWQDFMQAALIHQPVLWYPKPASLIAIGTGINTDYYLPGTVGKANTPYPCAPAYQANWTGVC